jgi:site-specific DNA recombinase
MTAMAAAIPAVRRVALYMRVSSDDQAQRGTIHTQADELRRRLASEPGVVIVGEYADDGVSGTMPLEDRPAGARLLADARAGLIDEAWVYDFDRFGRDSIENAIARRTLVRLGIRLVSVQEGEPDDFMFDIKSAVAANERRVFLRRTADGMNRAAREGRYCGGVAALGYRVEGHKQTARLVPDESPFWSDLSAADVVRRIYEWIALKGWSCGRVAAELNSLGVPTAAAREGTGVRARKTQKVWRTGIIRNMVANSLFKGQLSYGRRTKKRDREVITAAIEGLVSPALWDEAQAAFARNRRCAKNTHRVYLLKSVVKCGTCNLTYVGSWSQGVGWYRCGGQLVERGAITGRCPGCSIRADRIEPLIWADIEAWLRNPGDVLGQLDGARERKAAGAVAELEAITLRRVIDGLEAQRKQAIALNIRGRLPDAELDAELDRIAVEQATLEARVAVAESPVSDVLPQEARDLLSEVRARLDGGLTDEQRQEIARLLVGIFIHAGVGDDGKKNARAAVTYRFPDPLAGVSTRTGTGSSLPGAGTSMGRPRPDRRERLPRARLRSAGGAPPG